MLTLDHVGERLQRTLVRARNRATTAAVIEQGVNRFLQHTLLVAHDNVRRVKFEQAAQTIVAVDYAPVEIVEIRRCESAAIERYERTQIRRQHRQHGQHHPLRLVARLDK